MMTEGQRQVLIQYAIKFKSARNIYGSDIHEIRSLADFALAALTQPASPALKLPDFILNANSRLYCEGRDDVIEYLRQQGFEVKS